MSANLMFYQGRIEPPYDTPLVLLCIFFTIVMIVIYSSYIASGIRNTNLVLVKVSGNCSTDIDNHIL